MKRASLSTLCFLFVYFLLVPSPQTCAAPIPDPVKKVIGFIFVSGANNQLLPNGTCFFLVVRDPKKPETGWGYLVTAKHVLQDPSGTFYPKVWVRLNKLAGGVESFEVPLVTSGISKSVFVHTDSSVDLAVVPVAQPDPKTYDVSALPEEILTSQKDFGELHIKEGSDVFFTGMFLPHLGAAKNYPIARFGKVALLPEEKVVWNQIPTDLYLIETLAFGGNSGAPVFFYLGNDRDPAVFNVGPPVLRLAGIMEGFFNEFEPVGVVETRPVAVSKLNSGIAAVTPAYKLHEILFSPELQQYRRIEH